MSVLFIQNSDQTHNPNIISSGIFSKDISFYDIYCQICDLDSWGTSESFYDFFTGLDEKWPNECFPWYEEIKDSSTQWKFSHEDWKILKVCEKIFELKKKFKNNLQ